MSAQSLPGPGCELQELVARLSRLCLGHEPTSDPARPPSAAVARTPGAGLGPEDTKALRGLVLSPGAKPRTDAVRGHLRNTQHIAGASNPIDDAEEAAIAARECGRCADDRAAGLARQIQAIQHSGDRTAQLRTITTPTLVIHGDRDRVVAPTGGGATAEAIPSAQYARRDPRDGSPHPGSPGRPDYALNRGARRQGERRELPGPDS